MTQAMPDAALSELAANARSPRRRALLVDLNNFARYPTLSIGYLVPGLRAASIDVEVLCPLNHGVHPPVREQPETLAAHIERRINLSSHPVMTRLHETLRAGRVAWKQRPNKRVLEETIRALDRGCDVLLLSAYLDHYPSVRALAAVARERGIPVLLGGPMFNLPEVAEDWVQIPGLTAVIGAEVDLTIGDMVHSVLEGDDLAQYPGVLLPDGRRGRPAQPLRDLHKLPRADFSDFPWERYPHKIIPMMTGRGCSWGRCLFCSDVITANGRSYRSRPVESVLGELRDQAEQIGTSDVIFLDIKLNSDLDMWRGIIDGFQEVLPGGRWIGTVHVQARGENGLSAPELAAARESGMRRVSFGLETGSQKVNNSMAKGTSLERTSQFIGDAHGAGLSVRTTMMLGYPGEDAADVAQTIDFLRDPVNWTASR